MKDVYVPKGKIFCPLSNLTKQNFYSYQNSVCINTYKNMCMHLYKTMKMHKYYNLFSLAGDIIQI